MISHLIYQTLRILLMYTACLFNRTQFLSICTYIQLTAFCKVRRLGRRFDGDVVAIALCMFLNISACAEDICMIFLNSVLQMCCWKYRNIMRSESCTQQQQQQQQPKAKRQRKGANMQPKGNQREPNGSGKGAKKEQINGYHWCFDRFEWGLYH